LPTGSGIGRRRAEGTSIRCGRCRKLNIIRNARARPSAEPGWAGHGSESLGTTGLRRVVVRTISRPEERVRAEQPRPVLSGRMTMKSTIRLQLEALEPRACPSVTSAVAQPLTQHFDQPTALTGRDHEDRAETTPRIEHPEESEPIEERAERQ